MEWFTRPSPRIRSSRIPFRAIFKMCYPFISKLQTWVGYISLKIYIPEYILFEDIFTGYNIIAKNGIYDRDILGLIAKYILYPFLWAFLLFSVYLKNILCWTQKKTRCFRVKSLLRDSNYTKWQYFWEPYINFCPSLCNSSLITSTLVYMTPVFSGIYSIRF